MGALTGLTWDIEHGRALLSIFAGAAVICLGLGLSALWLPGIAWALALLGLEYGIRLGLDPAGTALWAPLFGAGLLVCAELAYLSLEVRADIRSRLRGRLGTIAVVALGSGVLGEALLFLAALVHPRAFALVVAGTTAVALLLLGLAVMSGRAGARRRPS